MKQQYLFYSLLFRSKLQSDLRTTNLEELNITVETYFEEVTSMHLDTFQLFHYFSHLNIKVKDLLECHRV